MVFLPALPAFAKDYGGPAGISHIGHVGALQLPSLDGQRKLFSSFTLVDAPNRRTTTKNFAFFFCEFFAVLS